MSARTVVFILSTNYAGSHFLSLLVGSHSRAVHLGEIKRLRKPRINWNQICPRCGPSPCRLMGGVGPHNIQQVFQVIGSRLDPAVTLLVDNSKSLHWAEQFLELEGYHRKYIHLIRDPRALVRRWTATYDTCWRGWLNQRWRWLRQHPCPGSVALCGRAIDLYTAKWLEKNRGITEFIRRHRLDSQVVTYEDLATDTVGELGRLMPWLGVTFEPAQCEYWAIDHHGSQKSTYEWVKQQRVRGHFDLRWQTELDDRTQARILQRREIREYVAAQGLAINPSGLTRCSPQECGLRSVAAA